MSFRFWIGSWTALILVILVAIDASALVCYITRFTEENFATLIAFIFIYKVGDRGEGRGCRFTRLRLLQTRSDRISFERKRFRSRSRVLIMQPCPSHAIHVNWMGYNWRVLRESLHQRNRIPSIWVTNRGIRLVEAFSGFESAVSKFDRPRS